MEVANFGRKCVKYFHEVIKYANYQKSYTCLSIKYPTVSMGLSIYERLYIRIILCEYLGGGPY